MTYGSMINHLMSAPTTYVPQVGDGATLLSWSDRHPYTIVAVRNERRVIVQADRATRTDTNGMSECQTYRFERDHDAPLVTLTKRKSGKWQRLGESETFLLGHRSKYHDFSF